MTTTVLLLAALLPAQPDPEFVITRAEPAFTITRAAEPAFVVTAPPKAKRVELNGLWYDRHADGKLDYCRECNKGKVPPLGAVVTVEEHDALLRAGAKFVPPAAPGVAAPAPFPGPTSTRTTLATGAGPASSWWPAGTPTVRTPTGAPFAATGGCISLG